MGWIKDLLTRTEQRQDFEISDEELEHRLACLFEEEQRKPELAVKTAHRGISDQLTRLETEEEYLANSIADLSERLRQVRVTHKALSQAWLTLQADLDKTTGIESQIELGLGLEPPTRE